MHHHDAISSWAFQARDKGAAEGMSFSGRQVVPSHADGAPRPLIIALHGGTYTSAYFDIAGHSLLQRAALLDIPVIAIDRPGYGTSTALAPADSTIERNAAVLDALIGEIWAASGQGAAGVVLIGHSIGGAVATAIAARQPSWPLLGLAVSGCLLEVPSESKAAWAGLPDIAFIDLPHVLKDGVMFGPGWTHGAHAPEASHAAHAPVPRAELIDITTTWPARVRAEAARVAVPVHARQGEFDALWISDNGQASAFGAAFTGAPSVDAQLFPKTGHCIDFHHSGAAFQLEQLAFALRCSLPQPQPAA